VRAVATIPVRTAAGLVATCSEVAMLKKPAKAMITSRRGSVNRLMFKRSSAESDGAC